MNRKLKGQCRRAEELGVAPELAAVLRSYLDQVEQLADECQDFRWGDACDHIQLVPRHTDEVVYGLGPLISVTYEASKGGQLAHWEHDFKAELPVLAYGQSGKLWILGGDYVVTDRGIVG